jgi:nucleotide-binding universal stress UspA family protein
MAAISTVLCPIDFSDTSRHALDHAIAVAKWYGARLVGIHVYTPLFYPVTGFVVAGYSGELVSDDVAIKRMEQDAMAALESARAAGLSVDVCIEKGPPANAILSSAKTLPADLIVIGTHGAGGFEHLLLGSVTERVLRRSPCPVMTVPPRARATSKLPFARVLCPIDFSRSSEAALRFACTLAQEADADLSLLHVLEFANDEPLPNLAFSVPEYNAYREQDAGVRLRRMIPDTVRNWCTPTTHIAHGKPHQEILMYAAREGADVIVMGIQGRNALDMMLFGSTTNQVIRRATCPVLTLRP